MALHERYSELYDLQIESIFESIVGLTYEKIHLNLEIAIPYNCNDMSELDVVLDRLSHLIKKVNQYMYV